MEITNNRGVIFRVGDVVYYNVLEKGALNISIKKSKIKSFLIKDERNVYIVTRNDKDKLSYVDVNDLYKDEEEAKEVILRWEREVLQRELKKEIMSSLMKA